MARTARKAITADMKINSLLYRHDIICAICQEPIHPGQEIEWDHVQALVHDGEHSYANIRPLHVGCHTLKTTSDVKANAKVKRLRGETCNKPGKKIVSRGFDKTISRGFDGIVRPR